MVLRVLLPVITAALLTFAADVRGETASADDVGPARRPDRVNVVLIFADDVGYGDIGCYGATKVRTPNIDRLAAEGRRFTAAHSASAVCTPSRYSLLTGEYSFRRKLWNPVFLRTPCVIDRNKLTIGQLMKRVGYATACIGKWHLGFGESAPTDWNRRLDPGPLEFGFDDYFGVPVVNSHAPFVYVENHHVIGLDPADPFVYGRTAKTKPFREKFQMNAIGGAEAAHAHYDDERVGTTLARRAVDWIQKHKSSPFFLYLATTNIHHPFTPAPRFKGTSDCGLYGDFIHELDWIVGEVLTALRTARVADNTLVIFTSDNGGMLNMGGQEAWRAGHRLNGDLLGFKFDAWEGGHRVPFVARWPGRIPPGTTSDQLISNVDLLATLAALTGQRLSEKDGLDSFDVLPALTGTPTSPIRDHLVISPRSSRHLTLRRGDWIYIGAKGGGGFTAKRIGEHLLGGPAAHRLTGQVNSDIAGGKLKPDAPPAQLYDLATDPHQRTNVHDERSKVAGEMKAFLKRCTSSARTAPVKP